MIYMSRHLIAVVVVVVVAVVVVVPDGALR